MSETIMQAISNYFIAGVGAAFTWALVTFIQQQKKIYDHVIKQEAINSGFADDIKRIEDESKEQYEDLKEQITDMRHTFESKLDNLAKEFRKSNH